MSQVLHSQPLTTLISVALERRTGEFVVAVGAREMHVFVREGLVAWATDSSAPAFFSRTVKDLCGIDDATFGDVVEECRRSRLPLGETLVSLGLASHAQVHDALRAQTRRVLQAMDGLEGATFMFLERPGYLAYRSDLTFELSELLKTEPTAPRATPPPVPPPVSSDSRLVDSLAELRDHAWTVECTHHQVLAQRGQGPEGLNLASAVLEQENVGFIAVRSEDFSLVGALRGEGRWTWTQVASPGALAKIIALLWRGAGRSTAWTSVATEWRRGVRDSGLWPVIDQAFRLAPPIAALQVLVGEQRCTAGRHGVLPEDASWGWTRARAVMRQLRRDRSAAQRRATEQVMLSLGGQLYFGIHDELPSGHETSVLAMADPGCPVGLGFAALSLLFRHAAHERQADTEPPI